MREFEALQACEVWLVRHGETEWSLSGAHTSRSDIPLTDHGRRCAAAMRSYFTSGNFSLVLSSPRQRATETCRLAGFGDIAEIDDNLAEWDYGDYEGRTTAEIRQVLAGWSVWSGEIRGGESLSQVAERAEQVIARVLSVKGRVLLFSHAHMLRVLAARWCELPAVDAKHLALGTGSLSVLGFERESRVIRSWNRSFEDYIQTAESNYLRKS